MARTIREAEKLLVDCGGFDLLLFDVTLPDGNGFSLCEKLRAAGDRSPIIFLTASDEETSVIRGLDCGGDDYITKPFKLGELCSRIRALLRRSRGQYPEENMLRFGDVVVNLTESRVWLAGESVEFTAAAWNHTEVTKEGGHCLKRSDIRSGIVIFCCFLRNKTAFRWFCCCWPGRPYLP